MLIGSDGTGWIEFSDYELARTIGDRRAGADPVRGRPEPPACVEIRPVLGTAVSLALIATPITAVIAGFAGGVAASTSTPRRAC